MGANYRKNQLVTASVEQLVEIIKSQEFSTKLELEFKEEGPAENGVWFQFYHGVSFVSWGEQIYILLSPVNQYQVNVDIVSRCDIPEQERDWGKNKKNVEGLFAYFEKTLAQRAAMLTQVGMAVPQPVYVNPVPVVQAPVVQPAPIVQPAVTPVYSANFCGNCGKPITPGTRFCVNCGMKL